MGGRGITKVLVLTALLLFLSWGCGKLQGDFGFKSPFEESFRKVPGVPEINGGEPKQWTFVFKDLTDAHEIGVFIMKKEVVWVEVTHFTKKVNREGNVIHGVIEGFPEGRYKIVLVEKKELIAEKEFLVYNDEESQ